VPEPLTWLGRTTRRLNVQPKLYKNKIINPTKNTTFDVLRSS